MESLWSRVWGSGELRCTSLGHARKLSLLLRVWCSDGLPLAGRTGCGRRDVKLGGRLKLYKSVFISIYIYIMYMCIYICMWISSLLRRLHIMGTSIAWRSNYHVHTLGIQDCAQNLVGRVDKTWRQLSSQPHGRHCFGLTYSHIALVLSPVAYQKLPSHVDMPSS